MTDKERHAELFGIVTELDTFDADLEVIINCLGIYNENLWRDLQFMKESPAARADWFTGCYGELDSLMTLIKEKLYDTRNTLKEVTDAVAAKAKIAKEGGKPSDGEAEAGGRPETAKGDS